MPIIANQELYNQVKKQANMIYKKPSAYKSGFIVKKYKELGGQYIDDNEPKNLKRWFSEKWVDIGGLDYPVYRPLKRISKETPLTASEIDPIQAIEQIALKQIIKGDSNLPKFKSNDPIDIKNVPKSNEIWKWSNPLQVRKKADKYLGKNISIYLSSNPKKKYMVKNTEDKWVHFGAIGYEDFTKHKDEKRRENYLTRSANIRGNWRGDPYSANNLSRNILW